MKPTRSSNESSAWPMSSRRRRRVAAAASGRLVGMAGNRQERVRAPLACPVRSARPTAATPVPGTGRRFRRRAAADGGDPRDRQQILDERLGAVVVGALQRRQHAGLGERLWPPPSKMACERRGRARRRAARAGARLGQAERAEDAVEKARIADPDLERTAAGRRRPPPSPARGFPRPPPRCRGGR